MKRSRIRALFRQNPFSPLFQQSRILQRRKRKLPCLLLRESVLQLWLRQQSCLSGAGLDRRNSFQVYCHRIIFVMYPRTTSSAGASRDLPASQGQHIPSIPCYRDYFYDAFFLISAFFFGNASFSSLLLTARAKCRFRLFLPGRLRLPVSFFSVTGLTL